MRKILLTFIAALICCFAFPTFSRAEMIITWDFSSMSGWQLAYNDPTYPSSFSNGGITLTVNNSNGMVVYQPNNSRQFYSYASPGDESCGSVFTFSCATANITRIEITSYYTLNSIQCSTGWSVASSTSLVWTGSASSVDFGEGGLYATQIEFTTDAEVNENLISGVFSVSRCTSVQFSKGNLQYRASDNSWQFANNQYDIIGNNAGNTTSSGRNSQSAWIDLFGWGTGDEPWKVSSNYSDYSTYTEWGSQFQEQTGWRTLTHDEWLYLLGGRYNSYHPGISFAKGTVNGVGGLILLPDDWSDSYYHLNNPNPSYSSSYSDNVLSASDWATNLEAHGAVFLPETGTRQNNNVYLGAGNYWTATPHESYNHYAYQIAFNNTDMYFDGYYTQAYRYNGLAVRLVTDYYTKPAATLTSAPTAKTGLVFNGSSQWVLNEGTANGGELRYVVGSNNFSSGSINYSPGLYNAGIYTIYYMVQGDDEHCDYTPENNSVVVTIEKANSSISSIPAAINDLVHTGSAQTLINAGSASGGTMQYKVGTGSWSNNLPQATEIGDYTVYYKVKGDNNHYDYDNGSYVTVTINPKTNYTETDAKIETCLAALTGTTDLTINRTVYKDGYYNTICLPVAMSAAEIAASDLADCELFAFDDASVSGSVLDLYITAADAIVAGVPYLIKWPNTSAAAQNISLPFSGVTIGATAGTRVGEGSVQFVGTIGRSELPAEDNYLFVDANNTLNWSNGDGTSMKAFRAYFIVGSNPVISPRHTPARLVVRPKLPTGVESVEQPCEVVKKHLENGLLIIEKNGVRYNAQGQLVR